MTDETISSMVQDVTHHKETEIRIITGAVCRLGREHHVPTPLQRSAFAVGFGQAVHLSGPLSKAGCGAFGGVRRQISCRLAPFHVPYGSSFLTQSAFCTMLYIGAYKERSKLP